jgi:5-formyltetrahydrofolate cyclo-ligase
MATDHKDLIRQRVWPRLREVAYPDSRFHYDFSSFIADFEGSDDAVEALTQQSCYLEAKVVFVTPDNCLEKLRYRALQDGKKVLVTTYAIRRGFYLLDPWIIDTDAKRSHSCLLDAMEQPGLGRKISLAELREQRLEIDMLVTGTGAINRAGIRFGKGHGFFDLEWAMLFMIGVVKVKTPCVAIVHDCQVLEEALIPEEFDTVCDVIITPSQIIQVGNSHAVQKPRCGILWERLQLNMLNDIPPLRELRRMNLTAVNDDPRS